MAVYANGTAYLSPAMHDLVSHADGDDDAAEVIDALAAEARRLKAVLKGEP